MQYDNIKIGQRCRISYSNTYARIARHDLKLIPTIGTIVIVLNKLNCDYAHPILIRDPTGAHYKVHPSDLVRYEYNPKGRKL